jgi:hypothetical protein
MGEEEKKVNFPKAFLPPDAEEGDYLKIEISRDEEKTAEAEAEALSLMQE